MTTVFLDTSVILDEQFFRSPTAAAFFKACALLKVRVVIPEVVLDEVRGNFPQWLREKRAAFLKAQRDLAKLMDFNGLEVELEKEVSAYGEWLKNFLKQAEIGIAPYPDVSAKELVEQSYVGQKPFKASGEGHKDYLVWKAIKVEIEEADSPPPHFFLTKNTKDFCSEAPDGVKILHPDLAGQIEDEARRPTVLLSLKDLFDKELAPELEGIPLTEFKELGKEEIEQQATEFLENELPQRTAMRFAGLPFNDDVLISQVLGPVFDEITLTKVGDEIVIDVSGNVELEVDGFIDKTEYYHMVDEGDVEVHVNDADWNDHVIHASTTFATPYVVTLIYSPKSKAFVGGSVQLSDEVEGYSSYM